MVLLKIIELSEERISSIVRANGSIKQQAAYIFPL
jgi:hypothetical protein